MGISISTSRVQKSLIQYVNFDHSSTPNTAQSLNLDPGLPPERSCLHWRCGECRFVLVYRETPLREAHSMPPRLSYAHHIHSYHNPPHAHHPYPSCISHLHDHLTQSSYLHTHLFVLAQRLSDLRVRIPIVISSLQFLFHLLLNFDIYLHIRNHIFYIPYPFCPNCFCCAIYSLSLVC